MKRLFFLFLLMLQLTTLPTAHAEKADSDKPTNVASDQLTYDDLKQITIATGNVVLARGTLLMKGARVVVSVDPSGYQFATLYAPENSVATFRQKRDGGSDLWIDGHAKRIEYDEKTEIIKLYADAQMRRLEGSKPTDEINGEFISYDSRSEFYSVNNTANGTSQPGAGRIKAIIQPREKIAK